MGKVIYYWNMVHYYLFVWQVALYKLLDYVNPFTYLFKIERVKKFYSKHGINDMNKFTDQKIFNAPEQGLNIIWAGINLSGLIIIFEYGLFNITQSFLGRYLIQYIWENNVYKISFVTILLIIPVTLNYLLVFREEKYLSYFNKFKKMCRQKKNRYGWLCGIFILLIWMFFILSFFFLPSTP